MTDVQAYFDTVADRPGIGYVHGPIWAAHEKPTLGERLCLPLWNQAPMDGPADGLIGATVPLPDMPREAMDARRVVIPLEAFFAAIDDFAGGRPGAPAGPPPQVGVVARPWAKGGTRRFRPRARHCPPTPPRRCRPSRNDPCRPG